MWAKFLMEHGVGFKYKTWTTSICLFGLYQLWATYKLVSLLLDLITHVGQLEGRSWRAHEPYSSLGCIWARGSLFW